MCVCVAIVGLVVVLVLAISTAIPVVSGTVICRFRCWIVGKAILNGPENVSAGPLNPKPSALGPI